MGPLFSEERAIIIIFFTRGKSLVAQKLQKKTTKLVWK